MRLILLFSRFLPPLLPLPFSGTEPGVTAPQTRFHGLMVCPDPHGVEDHNLADARMLGRQETCHANGGLFIMSSAGFSPWGNPYTRRAPRELRGSLRAN